MRGDLIQIYTTLTGMSRVDTRRSFPPAGRCLEPGGSVNVRG